MLELNSTGKWPSRSRNRHPWSNAYCAEMANCYFQCNLTDFMHHPSVLFIFHMGKKVMFTLTMKYLVLTICGNSDKSWRLKAIAHWVWNFRVRFPFFFVFLILPYQNACYGCENAESRTWSEFFYDLRTFWRQCVNVIDTTWGRIHFLTCENFGRKFRLSVQWPLTL